MVALVALVAVAAGSAGAVAVGPVAGFCLAWAFAVLASAVLSPACPTSALLYRPGQKPRPVQKPKAKVVKVAPRPVAMIRVGHGR